MEVGKSYHIRKINKRNRDAYARDRDGDFTKGRVFKVIGNYKNFFLLECNNWRTTILKCDIQIGDYEIEEVKGAKS